MTPTDTSPEWISTSQQLTFSAPAQKNLLPLLVEDWAFLRRKLQKIRTPKTYYRDAGFLLLGGAITAFVAALTCPGNLMVGHIPVYGICWGLLIFLGALGCTMFLVSYYQKQAGACSIADVLEEMTRIESRFRPSETLDQGSAEGVSAALSGLIHHYIEKGFSYDDIVAKCAERGYSSDQVIARLYNLGLLSAKECDLLEVKMRGRK